MTKEEILKRVKKFQGANREFSQELPPIIEGLVDLIDEAGPEVVDNLTSNSPTKALSANMGKELKLMVDGKVSEPETAGTAGQILQLDEEGVPEWVDAAEVGATYDSTVSDTSTNAIQNKTIKKYVDDNFAQKDGYYGSLTAGAAENLVGRGSVPAEFAFRTSGGDQDLGTGTAQIVKIKGRTEAFNQMLRNGNFADSSAWTVQNANLSVAGGVGTVTPTGIDANIAQTYLPIYAGHKYFVSAEVNMTVPSTALQINVRDGSSAIIVATSSAVSGWQKMVGIANAATTKTDGYIRIYLSSGMDAFSVRNFICIDLTLMYGAGNEPATPEAFEALHPLPYYNYNAGELKNNAATGLETTGFNQWDGENTEGVAINASTGEEENSAVCSATDYIPIFPNTTYYFRKCGLGSGVLGIAYYDGNKTYISGNVTGESAGADFTRTTPENAAFMRVSFRTDYVNEICINLSWSGYRNGEYEPYEKHTLNLPLNAIACHNGDTAVTVNGLDGVGTSYDEGVVENGMVTKIVKRIGEVDLGTLTYSVGNNVFRAPISDIKKSASTSSIANIICPLYTATTPIGVNSQDKTMASDESENKIAIKNTAYNDAAAFKAAMAGVKLRYELATPITLTVDEPFAASYYVNDFGTEERLPADTASAPQAPFCEDVQYAMNATDAIRNLPRNYVSINSNASDDSSLKALAAAISTALGIAVTWTWSESDREYTFSVADNRAFKLVSVPASASASGTAGNIAIDSSYLYICVATDTWKRVAIATWE